MKRMSGLEKVVQVFQYEQFTKSKMEETKEAVDGNCKFSHENEGWDKEAGEGMLLFQVEDLENCRQERSFHMLSKKKKCQKGERKSRE